MKQFAAIALGLALAPAIAQQPQLPGGRVPGRAPAPPAIQPKPEELNKVREKTEQIEALIKELKASRANPELLGDVEVYSKAGRMLQEFPELFGTQNAIEHSFLVLDQGIERARQLQSGRPHWSHGKKQIHAYYSEIEGSLQPYGVTLPENYDPANPARLYVWLHVRHNNSTEAEFIFNFLNPRPPGT